MATVLKFRRGDTATASAVTAADGEIYIDTTKKTIIVHDGSTIGGTPLATESAVSLESTERANADALLQANIDNEVINRTTADAILQSAISAEVTARTAANAALQSAISAKPYCQTIVCSDETTALTAGTNKVTVRAPFAMTLTSVTASLTTAQIGGNIFTVDVKNNGATIFTTKITIDNTEKTSKTAAAPAVISTAAIADDDEITIDIVQVGDGTAKGLKVYLIGTTA